MKISLIAAMAQDRIIGNRGHIPWNLPNEQAHFKALTLNKPIIMGRKTFESLKGPLPRRKNIVLTKQKDYRRRGIHVVHSVFEALFAASDSPEVMVIGGEDIYRLFMPIADTIFLTHIIKSVTGDTYFPEISRHEWKRAACQELLKDKKNTLLARFCIYERIAGD